MDRRDFVKLAGFAGLSMFFPTVLGREAHADPAIWGGPYFLHMHAAGGWDPTMLCDAKVTAPGVTPAYENRLITEVADINGIVVPTATAAGKFLLRNNNNPVEDPQNFFSTVGKSVLVLNGVDTQTNNHDTGVQGLACGHNDIELPALAALFAGKVAKQINVPMAFLAGGQYNRTGDVVGISRFPGDKVALLTDPYKAAPQDERALLSEVAVRRITELREERFSRLEAQTSLPRTKRTFNAFREAAKGGASVNLLKAVAGAPDPSIDSLANDLAPDTRAYLTAPVNNNGAARFIDMGRPLETVLRCFQAGVSASATFAQGGFDTHADHDTSQANAMSTFMARLRYVLLRAQQMNLRDKLYVMVTSDFGRTPRYNTGNGKDHWNVTSALLVGPGIRGGRAIGKTDEGHKALRVARGNVSQVLPDKDTNGVRIHPSHLHRELRRVLGIDQTPFIGQFPLPATDEPLPLLA
ncbi:MAG: DUF1501 domain-containing protein [Labilithrix sp.]|nr:DUF1501 domain-containing protein [Labilithrix sp.]MBX3221009.1 DUF1501 domain-containing protein [Labilithrix sp.]